MLNDESIEWVTWVTWVTCHDRHHSLLEWRCCGLRPTEQWTHRLKPSAKAVRQMYAIYKAMEKPMRKW